MWENFLSLRGQGAFHFTGLKAEEWGFFGVMWLICFSLLGCVGEERGVMKNTIQKSGLGGVGWASRSRKILDGSLPLMQSRMETM